MNLLVSIVTPSFNQGQFLEGTLKSVLAQSYEYKDLWVVDGGSTDQTVSLLRRYESRLNWISEPDEGQADALNKGFSRSRGEILGWLNADDLYCPGALEEVVRRFESEPRLMLLYGDAHHIDAEGNFLETYPSAEFHLESLTTGCFICQPACFFRRSLLQSAGLLDRRLQYAMDLDLWIRFGKLQRQHPEWKFRYLPKVLALSRMHRENKTLSKRREAYLEIIQVIEDHFGIVPFNWIYALEESMKGNLDGFFRRSSFDLSLLMRSLTRWGWVNRRSPGYVLSYILSRVVSPWDSRNRLAHRTGARW